VTEDQIAEARRLREEEGLSYRKIGRAIGASSSGIRAALNPPVKQRSRLRAAGYRANHKKEVRGYQATYYSAHKVQLAQQHKQYRLDHIEEINLRQAEYHVRHKEQDNQRSTRWDAEHREEERQRAAKWYTEHKKQARAYAKDHQAERTATQALRKALIMGALIGATANQRNEIKEIYRKAKEDKRVRCYLCGKLIPKGHRQVDHIIPLSKGGQHRPSNLAVACDKCNQGKHAKLPHEVGVLI